MAFESDVVAEDWRSVIVPLYKGKGEWTQCKNYRCIGLISVVRKIYMGILVDRVHRMTENLFDDDKGGFREGRGCVDQIFTLKQIGGKHKRKNVECYVGFIDLAKAYNRVNRETLWQVFRMYDVGGKLLHGIRVCILIVQFVLE